MKKLASISAIFLLSLSLASTAFSHSGRTDSSGGHNCSAKSISKGLCTGYHYHNGGSSSSGSSSSYSSSSSSNSGSSTSASKGIKVSLPTFNIHVNDVLFDNSLAKYPLIVYKNITYFPMTWNFTQALGIETSWNSEVGFSVRRTEKEAAKLNYDYGVASSNLYAKSPGFNIYVNDVWLDNSKEEYPVLALNDITYFPMTWKFAVEELGLTINFDQTEGFSISK